MQLLENMSRNPAEVYGLTGRAVREGNYARLVLLDWDSEKIYSEYKSKGIRHAVYKRRADRFAPCDRDRRKNHRIKSKKAPFPQ